MYFNLARKRCKKFAQDLGVFSHLAWISVTPGKNYLRSHLAAGPGCDFFFF